MGKRISFTNEVDDREPSISISKQSASNRTDPRPSPGYTYRYANRVLVHVVCSTRYPIGVLQYVYTYDIIYWCGFVIRNSSRLVVARSTNSPVSESLTFDLNMVISVAW